MASSGRDGEKQVRLTVFDNEPMARLAEQRLREAGIPCNTRSLRGGPGLWGSAYNLPHDLYVFESDQARAKDVLEIAPSGPQQTEGPDSQPQENRNMWRVLAGAALVLLVLVLIISLFNRSG